VTNDGDAAGREKEESMKVEGPAVRLTIVIGESDQWHHRPLYTEIVHRAHAAGLAGATVMRGIEGYGASSLVHTARLVSLGSELPVAVVIVDSAERIDAFQPVLDEIVADGLVIRDAVHVVAYRGREPKHT
jgi:PII-like signaling protein